MLKTKMKSSTYKKMFGIKVGRTK